MAEPDNGFWRGAIETREHALKVVKYASIGFFIVASSQVLFSFFEGFEAAIDGIIFAVFAFVLYRFKSRAAAVALLILSLTAVAVTGANMLTGGRGGTNVILAAVLLWASVRAAQATFKLHNMR